MRLQPTFRTAEVARGALALVVTAVMLLPAVAQAPPRSAPPRSAPPRSAPPRASDPRHQVPPNSVPNFTTPPRNDNNGPAMGLVDPAPATEDTSPDLRDPFGDDPRPVPPRPAPGPPTGSNDPTQSPPDIRRLLEGEPQQQQRDPLPRIDVVATVVNATGHGQALLMIGERYATVSEGQMLMISPDSLNPRYIKIGKIGREGVTWGIVDQP